MAYSGCGLGNDQARQIRVLLDGWNGKPPDPTLGATDDRQVQITALQRTLHNIALSAQIAEAASTQAPSRTCPETCLQQHAEAARQLRQQWQTVKIEVDRLVAEQRAAEMPSALETWTAGAANFARGLGRNLALAAAVGLALMFAATRGGSRHW